MITYYERNDGKRIVASLEGCEPLDVKKNWHKISESEYKRKAKKKSDCVDLKERLIKIWSDFNQSGCFASQWEVFSWGIEEPVTRGLNEFAYFERLAKRLIANNDVELFNRSYPTIESIWDACYYSVLRYVKIAEQEFSAEK